MYVRDFMIKNDKSGWFTWIMVLSMPILLIGFLGCQMAYSQVNSRFRAYREIPEITNLDALHSLSARQTVLVRGKIKQTERVEAGEGTQAAKDDLLVYQARPLDGREVRFLEEFPLVFPELRLVLDDDEIHISPSTIQAPMISHELHRSSVGDRELTGFRSGDQVSIQGQWQPHNGEEVIPTLSNVTGLHGIDKSHLVAEVESALRRVGWARNGLGILTLLSIVLLVWQLLLMRRNQPEQSKGAEQE